MSGFYTKNFEEIQVMVLYQRWTHECILACLKFKLKYLRCIFVIVFCLNQLLYLIFLIALDRNVSTVHWQSDLGGNVSRCWFQG